MKNLILTHRNDLSTCLVGMSPCGTKFTDKFTDGVTEYDGAPIGQFHTAYKRTVCKIKMRTLNRSLIPLHFTECGYCIKKGEVNSHTFIGIVVFKTAHKEFESYPAVRGKSKSSTPHNPTVRRCYNVPTQQEGSSTSRSPQ